MSKPTETLRAVRAFIRQPYAWPGGYPMALLMSDGETLCAKCARAEYRQISNSTRHALRDGWRAADVFVHWEGAPLICAHCGAETASAYGDPDADEDAPDPNDCPECARSYGPHYAGPCEHGGAA